MSSSVTKKPAQNSAPAGKSPGKLPLRLKLRAWWEGYDPKEIEKRLNERAPQEELKVPVPKKAEKVLTGAEKDEWDNARTNVNQYIWGQGFCGPGGPDYIVQLSKLLALSPEMSMLQIGAGLGGPARVLADRFGAWITGYEESQTLVEKGNQLSLQMGMEKKAEILRYNPETLESFDRKFDRALAIETLFTIENKRNIVNCVEDKLKPGGLFLITDYVLDNDGVIAKDSYKEWKASERTTPHPVLADDLETMLKDARMQVRVSEDITMNYVEMINKAWAGADAVAAKLARMDDGGDLIQLLMREAEFWTRRKKMFEKGHLRLWRIAANKKANGPSMMSDW